MQAIEIIFGMQVDDDVLYCEIGNQPSAYSSLYLSSFLSFHTLKNEFFVEPCKLEKSYLVFRLMMMCCIVGLWDCKPAFCMFFSVFV